MIDRPDKRPEIEPFYWELNGNNNLGVLSAKEKPDLIIFDPPYFDKKAKGYAKKSISTILVDDYLKILAKTGWLRTHIIQAPLSSERFEAGVVSAMQKKKILGVTSRYVIILNQAR